MRTLLPPLPAAATAPVRLILGITLILLAIGSWSCQIDGLAGGSPVAASEAPWVRTVDGWERASWLAAPTPAPSSTQLHPLIVAGGQLLISLMALAACAWKQSDELSA